VNGIHDMGGRHGFGRVEVEADEPVFHARWEGRVFGIVQALGARNIDAGRHAIERLDPVAYLRDGYWGRWLAALEGQLHELGILAPAEIEARVRRRRSRPPRRRHPASRTGPAAPPPRGSYVRASTTPPAFAAGATVVTRNHQPAGHTRLPAYARCRRGTVVRVHPAMVFPDAHAHGLGEQPQHLYTVRFDGAELWGAAAEPGTVVHVDLFEPYLAPA
jgi:nitrile hydratase